MAESAHLGLPQLPEGQAPHPGSEIDSLRAKGADRFDPVRFHFVETLARRALQYQGETRRILEYRLTEVLAAYRERFEQAQSDAEGLIAHIATQYPEAAADLQRLSGTGDFRTMSRFVARLRANDRHAPLADLTRHIAQHSSENTGGSLTEEAGSRCELKSLRNFRNTWSKLSVDKQVAQEIGQAPANAGPLNSHMLVLRSFALMREISPDYLNRFMSYADALLWLDQADQKSRPLAKKTTHGEDDKKQKGSRVRSR